MDNSSLFREGHIAHFRARQDSKEQHFMLWLSRHPANLPRPTKWQPEWTGFVMSMLMVLALTACGHSTGIASDGGPGQPTATAMLPATSQTGCPSVNQSVAWPAPPAVVLTTPFPTGPTTLRAGQALEVALPFGHVWRFQAGSEHPALTLDQPAGYGDSGTRRCVWHFTAQQAGQVKLNFTMQALCPPHTSCPLYIMLLQTTITVTPSA